MSDKKPNVFQTHNDIKKTADQSAYLRPINVDPSLDFEEQERIRTEEQKKMRDEAIRITQEMANEGEELRRNMVEQSRPSQPVYQAQPPVAPPVVPPSNDDDYDDDDDDGGDGDDDEDDDD